MRRLIPVLVAAAVAACLLIFAAGCGGGDSKTGASHNGGGSTGSVLDEGTASSPSPEGRPYHGPVPILMYHAISPPPAGNPYPDLFIPQAEFEDQMRWLDKHGYHGVTLDQVWAAWKQGDSLPAKPIVISFDDGLASQYVGARPILNELGWPAVLNLEINHVFQGEMTPAMIRDLIGDGWELDSHTFTHPDLTTIDAASLRREIAGSRHWLQQHFDAPVNFFCYPAGAYDDAAIAAVKAAGYEGATTTEPGFAQPDGDPFTLNRIEVLPEDQTHGLAQKLASDGSAVGGGPDDGAG